MLNRPEMPEMFQPRGTRAKRSNTLTQVRVDDAELAAVHWLQRRMSAKVGKDLSTSDVLRLAVAHLYQAEGGPDDPSAEQIAEHTKPTISS